MSDDCIDASVVTQVLYPPPNEASSSFGDESYRTTPDESEGCVYVIEYDGNSLQKVAKLYATKHGITGALTRFELRSFYIFVLICLGIIFTKAYK
jgi:hypothetical protein